MAKRVRNEWTMTPVQALLGRRVGFKSHWKYWATGLTCAFAAGTASGVKIMRQVRDRGRGGGEPQSG